MNNAKSTDFEDLKDELKRLTRRVEEIATESGETIIHKAEDMFDNVKDEFRDRMDEVIEGTKKTGQKLTDYVEDNPWQVALFVFSIGFIAGVLATRPKEPQ